MFGGRDSGHHIKGKMRLATKFVICNQKNKTKTVTKADTEVHLILSFIPYNTSASVHKETNKEETFRHSSKFSHS